MPFPMKIQPIDSYPPEGSLRTDHVKPVAKSRFKRLFERQFQSVLRISSAAEKQPGTGGESQFNSKEVVSNGEFEPSSVCLAKMVQSFIEESSEKQTVAAPPRCGRRRCNCFNGNCNDSSDDELEFCCGGFSDSITTSTDSTDALKSLVACPSVGERNLLADTSKIVEINKTCKNKDEYRKIVTDALVSLGYDAGICKSRWEKSPSFPAGEYEYIDVITTDDKERLLVDIDFRSEFEIARSTGNYKGVLQTLPSIFVGKTDRLQQIVTIVSEAAKQSMKKKGMHFPPWRKADYMKAKWLSPYTRTSTATTATPEIHDKNENEKSLSSSSSTEDFSSEFELIFGEKEMKISSDSVAGTETTSVSMSIVSGGSSLGGEKFAVVVSSSPWMPPAIKPRSSLKGSKMVAGLASVFKEKP